MVVGKHLALILLFSGDSLNFIFLLREVLYSAEVVSLRFGIEGSVNGVWVFGEWYASVAFAICSSYLKQEDVILISRMPLSSANSQTVLGSIL